MLHEKCIEWIQNESIRHLKVLNNENILNEHVTATVLYTMMHSVVSMQLYYHPKVVEAIDTVKRVWSLVKRNFTLGYRDLLICGEANVEEVVEWIVSIMVEPKLKH